MAEPSAPPEVGPATNRRLDSWKAIAAYLDRDVTTVQRWERREGLPVHRHVHDKQGSVYAFSLEVDAWLRARRSPGSAPADPLPTSEVAPGESRADTPLESSTAATVHPSGLVRLRTWVLAAGLLVALAVALLVWRTPRRAATRLDPLEGAQYQVLSDFEGTESAAAISRDGQLVAFVSDRDGRPDIWVTRIGTSQFHNVTQGRVRELLNPDIRTLGFSPDGSEVTFWARGVEGAVSDAIGIWAVPRMGGAPRVYLENVAEYEWDWRAERLVAHSPAPGDPTFIQRAPGHAERAAVFTAADGRHAHFPTWSPDGQHLYVVLGVVPDALDIFRMRADGTGLERLTRHGARVTHPVFLDARTLLYLRSDGQQAGGTLHALDVESLTSRSLARGLDRYLSLSATADGRRIVATAANTKRTLWRGTAADRGPSTATSVVPVGLATASGWAPRFSHNGLLYVTWKGDGHALWSASNGGGGGEIWQAANTRIAGGPAVSMDGRRVAMMVEHEGHVRALVMNADGTGPREVGNGVALRGEPDWAPDAASLAAGAMIDGQPHLARLPLDGAPVSLVAAFGLDPAWSPNGRMVVYSGPDIGTQIALAAATPDGAAAPLPPITLPRGARRVRFVDGGRALVVLRGDFRHKELWRIELATGAERQLTAVPGDFLIRDYDVTADGRQFVLERVQEHSDIVLIERRP